MVKVTTGESKKKKTVNVLVYCTVNSVARTRNTSDIHRVWKKKAYIKRCDIYCPVL